MARKQSIWLLLVFSSCMISMSKEEQVQNRLDPPSLTRVGEGEWPKENWWREFGVAELNGLIETALEQNPSIESVSQRIEYARSEAVIRRSELLPIVYFDGSDQWQYMSKNGFYRALNPDIPLSNQQIDFSLSFSWELDFWGKYRNLYRAELGKMKAAIAETAQTALIVSTSLAQSYFGLQTNLIRKQLYERLWQIRKRYFDLQEKMRQSALYSKLEPLLSEEDVFQARQFLLQIQEEIEVGKHQVNILAGFGPDAPLRLNQPLGPLPKSIEAPQDISSKLISRRPDLMAQIWRLDALAKEVGAAKADFFPNVNILGFLGLQSGSWSNLLEWASKAIGATPGFSLPVYTSGAIAANVYAKKALFDEALYHYNDLLLKSFQQVADLLSIGQSVYGKKQQQDKIVNNAAARLELTELRLRSGLDSMLTAYRFEEALIMKQLEDVELLFQQYVVAVSLIRALGGGYTSGECP